MTSLYFRWSFAFRMAGAVALAWVPASVLAATYALDREEQGVVGEIQRVETRFEDTLVDIGRRFNVGYEELRLANPGVDPWLPGDGTGIVIPSAFVLPDAGSDGIVMNLAEYRLYFFYTEGGQRFVATLPASIGKMDWKTPLGRTRIVDKVARPSWFPPDSVRKEYAADGRSLPRVVPPGPDNPLGNYALRLGLPGYLIHGTNRPAGVGMQVTHGCIRLFPEDIEWLFPRVPKGLSVRIVNEPVKFGWRGDDLYIEAHPPLAVGSEASGETPGSDMPAFMRAFVRATAENEAEVDWKRVREVVLSDRNGIPVKVGRRRAPVD